IAVPWKQVLLRQEPRDLRCLSQEEGAQGAAASRAVKPNTLLLRRYEKRHSIRDRRHHIRDPHAGRVPCAEHSPPGALYESGGRGPIHADASRDQRIARWSTPHRKVGWFHFLDFA